MSDWERILEELKICSCPFCGNKLSVRNVPGASYPIFDCTNNDNHREAGEIWAWYKDDSIKNGIIQVNIRMFEREGHYYQICLTAKNFYLQVSSDTALNVDIPKSFSLFSSKESVERLIKTILVFS